MRVYEQILKHCLKIKNKSAVENVVFSPQFAMLALAGVQLSSAEDDGQYRPYLYGTDDGRYRPTENDRYYQSRFSNFGSNGKYVSIIPRYQPVVVSPYQNFGFRDLNGFVN